MCDTVVYSPYLFGVHLISPFIVLKVTSGKLGEDDEQGVIKGVVKKPMHLIKRPTPQAIYNIEEYIRKHRLRLVDMFTRMDKNKDWLISCSECKQLFRELKVPISDDEVEQFIVALDRNNDGYLDYRELLKGRLAYKLERQQKKKKIDEFSPKMTVQSPQFLSAPGSSSGSNVDDMSATDSVTSTDSDIRQQKKEKTKSKQKQHPKKSPQSSQSIRMRQHIAPSTLHGSTAQRVDHYRQEELKQFQNLLHYCRSHGIVLNQSLLERGE